MSILELLPSLIVFVFFLFPPANFWVRLLILIFAIVLQAFIILAEDKVSSQNATEYAQNYPD